MTIQWFPGHMAKARREIEEKLSLIDVVIELLDARLPKSSQNPMLKEIIGNKPRIIILNKADMADDKLTRSWVNYYENNGIKAVPVNSHNGEGLAIVIKYATSIESNKNKKLIAKGFTPQAVRAVILGIPNVGKSTLINKLAKKTIAKASDKPGVTKKQQWIKIENKLELLDTPGILWPKFDDQETGFRLAISGAIKEDIFDFEEVAFWFVKYLSSAYPDLLLQRYNITKIHDDAWDTLIDIGRKRGCIMSGGKVDTNKTSELLYREFRNQRLGNITLENPDA